MRETKAILTDSQLAALRLLARDTSADVPAGTLEKLRRMGLVEHRVDIDRYDHRETTSPATDEGRALIGAS